MGLIATLLKLTSSKKQVKGDASGDSAIATGEGFEGQTLNPEIYQNNGIFSLPGDGVKGVYIPVGGNSSYGVVIASHNYQISIDISQGETAIYSTNASGQLVKALIKLKADGTIEFNGNSKKFVTADELETAINNILATISAHTHPVSGPLAGPSASLASLNLDITPASTTTLKTGG